jgi:dihydrofolate reductase
VKKVIFQMSVSLDGCFEGLNGEIDWHLVDAEFNAYAVHTLEAADLLIMGRRTYELMAGYWPTATDNDPVVKDKLNGLPKLVFSKTLKKVEWQNSRLATLSITEEVARLKAVPGNGLLWVGGNALATSFLEQGLMDEVRVILTPILLGGGNTVFHGVTRRYPLTLLSTKTFKSGNVLLIYQPALR